MQAKYIYEICKKISDEIESDFGGGSPLDKTFLMAYIIKEFELKSYMEIGVYRGKSFFPCAYAIGLNGGTAIGIDPYEKDFAYEEDCEEFLKIEIDKFIKETDFNKIYEDVLSYKSKYDYFENAKLIREPSNEVLIKFIEEKRKIDIIHIDGNHDIHNVKTDFEYSSKILNAGGFIIFDDIDWDSVNIIYSEAKKEFVEIFRTETFGILYKYKDSEKEHNPFLHEKLNLKLSGIYNRLIWREGINEERPRIAIGVITYNHKSYILECIESLINQKGSFEADIIICDDNSTDGTDEIIKDYIEKLSEEKKAKIIFSENSHNIGSVKNFEKLMGLIEEGKYDYVTFCEGDDYLLASNKIQKHLDLHLKNPEIAISFNHLAVRWENDQKFEIAKFKADLTSKLKTENLVMENFIANLGNSFYSGEVFSNLRKDIYDFYLGDWILNIILSQYGDLVYMPELFNVYRKHKDGVWSGEKEENKCMTLLDNMYLYNKHTNYLFDKYFSKLINLVKSQLEYMQISYRENEILIVDDIFPSTLSEFRYEEFNSIMENIGNVEIVCTGESILQYTNKSPEEVMVEYKRNNENFADKVFFKNDNTIYNAKLLYCVFVGNAFYNLLPIVKKYKIPFVFTLYPGGAFAMNSPKNDKMLKSVMESPYFRKVIVTQQVTYDYLIKKGYCEEDKIEFIFGGVTPEINLQADISSKKYFGENKKQLDIAFVAQKYTKYGTDKGYDVFIKAAKVLSQKYDNVKFHIVGPWDEDVIDILGIKDIEFYGIKDAEWFQKFYENIDIIVSPNINNEIGKGWFDGFPTGCVLGAMLRGVVAICTDPLDLNGGRFNKDEMIIVEHYYSAVVNEVENIIANSEKLREIGERGYAKANKLFSYKSQMIPRLEVLEQEIEESIYSKNYAEVSGLWESYTQEEGNKDMAINDALDSLSVEELYMNEDKSFSRKIKNLLKEKLPYPAVRFLKKIHHLWLGMKQI